MSSDAWAAEIAHYPGDDVLLALGRMTWNAVGLEDRTYALIEVARGEDSKRLPVGPAISDAVAALETWPDAASVTDGVAWLKASRDALAKRNAVLHATPFAHIMQEDDGSYRPAGYVLAHTSRMNTYSETALTVDEITLVADELRSVWMKWRDTVNALYELRRQREHAARSGSLPPP